MSESRASARHRLKQWLPWARAEARKLDGTFKLGSLGEVQAPYVREDNFAGIRIYEAPLGGWHADLVLKKVPPGVPNTLGTPVGSPCRTRAEAVETGRKTLVFALKIAAENKAKPTDEGVFLFYDWAVPIDLDILEIGLLRWPHGVGGPNGGFVSKEQAIQRIEEVRDKLFPGGVTEDALNNLALSERAALRTILGIAAMTDVFAYPPREDRSPSGHGESSTRH